VLVLALDTSTPAVTAALAEVTDSGLKGVGERRVVDPRAHGELLAPEISALLADAGVTVRDLAAIVAGLGPGPFTGLRVGLVTAAAMGQALGIPTYGVCSLDALGRAAGPGRVLVATDARRREVYYATYDNGVRVTGPDVAKPADVAENLAKARAESLAKASADPVGESGADPVGESGADPVGESGADQVKIDRAVGEGALKYSEIFGVPIDDRLLYPSGEALIALALDRIRGGDPSEHLTPLYLRRPDAVESASRKHVLQ
jgi:tRNA threonylcarbamoyl adenosine modification protein YeaZ